MGDRSADQDFLGRLGPDTAADFERLGVRRRFPGGAALFVEGDHAHEVFVLLAGEVKLAVGSAEGQQVVLDVFEAGALLGELSVIDGGPRSATVVALSPVEVLAVAATTFNEFLDRNVEDKKLIEKEETEKKKARKKKG